jgi:uncharacterized phage-like protein YoqJ
MTVRILITGSRTWDDPEFVDDAICDVIMSHYNETDFVVVHGTAKGADQMAGWAVDRLQREWSSTTGRTVREERHPANWNEDGKRAGYLRNQEMVDAGADICLAFIHNDSKGATMCADLAEEAGIPVLRYERTS